MAISCDSEKCDTGVALGAHSCGVEGSAPTFSERTASARRRLNLAGERLSSTPALSTSFPRGQEASERRSVANCGMASQDMALTRKDTITNLPESIEDLREVLYAQEKELQENAKYSAADWYAAGTHKSLKGKDIHNTHKTTLGLLLLETKIDHLLPGGPAFHAGLQKGDKIVAVDGKTIPTDSTGPSAIQQALSASDIEGDQVKIAYERAGTTTTTTIVRMASARVQSLRDLFDLLAQAQQHARDVKDERAIELNNEIVDGVEQILHENHNIEQMVMRKLSKVVASQDCRVQTSKEIVDRIEAEALDSHYHIQMLEHDLSNRMSKPPSPEKSTRENEDLKRLAQDRLIRIQELEAQLAQRDQEETERKKQLATKMHWEGRSVYVV